MTAPIKNRADLENLGKETQAAALGMIVAWDVDSGLLVPQDEMIALLQQYALDGDVKLPKIRIRKALRRALEDMADQNLLRMIINDAEHTVYALVTETVDKNTDEPAYKREIKVTVWKDLDNLPPLADPDGLQFHDPIGTRLGHASAVLRPLIDKYRQAYTAQDISEMLFLATVWAKDGITLRNQGGTYFVPERHRDLFTRLASFAQVLQATYHSECYLHLYAVYGTVAERTNLAKRVVPNLLGQVDEAVRELRKMVKRQQEDGAQIRAETITRHVQMAEDLRARAELYRDLLEMDMSTVNGAIDALITGLQQVRAVDAAAFAVFHEAPAAPTNPFEAAPGEAAAAPALPAEIEASTLYLSDLETEPAALELVRVASGAASIFDADDGLPDFDFDEEAR
jgi:hypothetical protein